MKLENAANIDEIPSDLQMVVAAILCSPTRQVLKQQDINPGYSESYHVLLRYMIDNGIDLIYLYAEQDS